MGQIMTLFFIRFHIKMPVIHYPRLLKKVVGDFFVCRKK